jgi:hypothetical protein
VGLVLLLSCKNPEFDNGTDSLPINNIAHSDSHFPIKTLGNAEKLQSLKTAALLGEAGRASNLVEIYENCVSRNYSGAAGDYPSASDCEREMRFWIRIGAENGDLDLMGVRFNEYFAGTSCADTYRAKYWLNKIIRRDRDEPWLSMEIEIKKRINNCGH